MENILSLSNCAPQRGNSSKPPTLIFRGGAALFSLSAKVFSRRRTFTFLLLLAMWCFAPEPAIGQQGGPGSAWTAGVDFRSNSPVGEDTWAFDAVEMSNGDFVIVGYAETDTGSTRVPAYAVLDKLGALKRSDYYDYHDGAGSFAQVAKNSNNYCILAGWQGPKAVLTKLDQNYNEVWRRRFDLPTNDGTERLQSVEVLPNGNILLSGGFRFGENPHGGTFFVICDTSGNPIPNKTAIFPDVDGKILDCKTVSVGDSTYVLATGFKIINEEQDWKFQVKELGDDTDLNADGSSLVDEQRVIQDWDVMVGIFNVERIDSNMSSSAFKYYNSKDFDYQSFGVGDAAGGSNTNTEIWAASTCADVYGPCTPGKSAKTPGWGANSINGSPVVDRYLGYNGAPRPSFASKDVGRSITYSNGFVYVAAEMNTFEMTGSSYPGFHRNGQNGVELRGLDCDDPDDSLRYGAYKDAYIHLMKFNLLTGQLVDYENMAHCSGGDFYATIVTDQNDGKIVLATTTADRGICGLPAIDECAVAEVHLLMKVDTLTLQPIWQQHYLADAEGLVGSCAFGLIQTADGGFLVIGNNETEDENGNDDETFTIVKFNSDCQYQQSAGGAFFDQNGDYTLTQDEIWTPTNKPNPYRVRGNITVPSGKNLVITNGLEVQFAYSKNDVEGKKTGITVQAGGKLYVSSGAVLTGINCGGAQMWDGVTVEGIPTQGAGAIQGYVSVTGTTTRIENAVRGIVLGGTAWEGKETSNPVGGAIGTLFTNNYNDNLKKGGGRLLALYGTFRNCGKGVVWNPMNGPTGQPASNKSQLLHTKFEFTAALADPTYLRSAEGPGDPIASELGCQLRSVKDISFSNVSFLNTMAGGLFPVQRARPTGIYAVDSKFLVTGGAANPHYGKLYVGVESSSALGGAASTISITSKFDQVYQGVNLRGNIAPVVSGCQFNNIPDEIDGDDGDPVGVHSVGTQGILLSANFFDSEASRDNFAARVNNSLGTGGAKVEFNTFTDMNVANKFEQDNSSLQTHCNTYQGAVGDVSWDVKGVLASQLQAQDPTYFPDNKFLWECDDPLLDISSFPSFSYYERMESPANTNTILKCFTPTVIKALGNSFDAPNCVIEDPCPNPPYCNELLGLYTSSGNSLPYRNDLLNAYVRMSPDAVADSLYLPGTTRAITLLASRNQQEDKRILTSTYASLGDYTTAQQYLQQVTGATTEILDFISYYTVLVDAGLAGRDIYHLTASEFAQLAPLMTHSSSVAENVRVLDHILNGIYHPLEAETGSGGRSSGRSDKASQNAPPLSYLSVFPNPFNNEVRFVAPEGIFVTALTVMDITGKVIYEQNYGSGEASLDWQAANLADGILFYRCSLSNGETVHGKLLHSKKQ